MQLRERNNQNHFSLHHKCAKGDGKLRKNMAFWSLLSYKGEEESSCGRVFKIQTQRFEREGEGVVM